MDIYAMKVTVIFVISCFFWFGIGFYFRGSIYESRRAEKVGRNMRRLSQEHRGKPERDGRRARRYQAKR